MKYWRGLGWLCLLAACAHPGAKGVLFRGTLHIDSSPSAEALEIGVVDGDLTISGEGAVTLPKLVEVRGDLHLQGELSTLELTSLRRVGGSIIARGLNGPDRFDLPALENIGGSLRLEDSRRVTRVVAPRLREVGGELSVTNQHDLLGLDLASLRRVGTGMVLSNNPALRAITLGKLERLSGGDLVFDRLTLLTHLEAPSLRSLAGGLTISRCGALRGLHLGSLLELGGALRAMEAPSLEVVVAPRLARVGGDVQLLGSPSLARLDLSGLAEVQGAFLLGGMTLETIDLGSLRRVRSDVEVRATGLTALRLPNLIEVGGNFIVQQNPGLEEMVWPAPPTIAGDVDVSRNALPLCVTLPLGHAGIRADRPDCPERALPSPTFTREQRIAIERCVRHGAVLGRIAPGAYHFDVRRTRHPDGTLQTEPLPAGLRGVEACIAAVPTPLGEHTFAASFRIDAPGQLRQGMSLGSYRVSAVWGPTRPKHAQGITALVAHPPTERFASADLDGVIFLWDGNGELLEILEGHEGPVRGMTFTAEGDLLSVGQDGRCLRWGGEANPQPVVVHPRPLVAVAAGRDGSVWLGDDGGTLLRAHPTDPTLTAVLHLAPQGALGPQETFPLEHILVTPEGALIVAGPWGEVMSHDPISGLSEVLPVDTSGWQRLTSVALSDDGATLAVAGAWGEGEHTLKLLPLGGTERGLAGEPLTSVGFLDDRTLIALGEGGPVQVRDATLSLVPGVFGERLTALALTPRHLVAAGSDGGLAWFQRPGWHPAHQGHRARVHRIVTAREGHLAASLDIEGQIILWDTERNTRLHEWSLGAIDVALSHDGAFLAVVDAVGKVTVLNPKNGERLFEHQSPFTQGAIAVDLSLPERLRLVTAREVITLDRQSGAVLARVSAPPNSRLAALGKNAAFSFGESRAIVWSPTTGDVLRSFEADAPLEGRHHLGLNASRALLTTGRSLAWVNLETGEPVRVLSGHARDSTDCALAEDRWVFSASMDGSVHRWDLTGALAAEQLELSTEPGVYPSAVAVLGDDLLVGMSHGPVIRLSPATSF